MGESGRKRWQESGGGGELAWGPHEPGVLGQDAVWAWGGENQRRERGGGRGRERGGEGAMRRKVGKGRCGAWAWCCNHFSLQYTTEHTARSLTLQHGEQRCERTNQFSGNSSLVAGTAAERAG